GASLFQQMLDLHDAQPSLSVGDVAARLHVVCTEVAGIKQQQRLRRIAKLFSGSRLLVRQPNVIMTDATNYHIWSLSGPQWLEINLNGGPSATNPLIQWAETVHREVIQLRHSRAN